MSITKAELQARLVQKRKDKKESINRTIEIKKQSMLKSVTLQYESLVQNQTDKIKKKYKLKLDRRLAKITKQYDARKNKTIKEKVYKHEVKKKEIPITKMKSKALAEIQKYAKLSRAYLWNGKIMIFLIDKLSAVELTSKVNGGHCYGQRNYPHMAFDIQNIRPISGFANKMQGDQVAQWMVYLPEQTKEYLKEKSEDKLARNNLRDHEFYQAIISKYSQLNDIEMSRLGMLKKVDR